MIDDVMSDKMIDMMSDMMMMRGCSSLTKTYRYQSFDTCMSS